VALMTGLVFGRCPVYISTRVPVVVAYVLRDFRPSVQRDVGVMPPASHGRPPISFIAV
jgi:hypothetical protein